MLTGGLLPFPRTGCVLYAKAILSQCSRFAKSAPDDCAESHGRDTVLLGRNLADDRGGVTSAVPHLLELPRTVCETAS
jgi:hypothetical protein